MTQLIITLCTCPDKDTAEKIARLLVEESLAACVNILPNIRSIYSWEGQVESAEEHLLIIKSPQTGYQAIETAIRRHHPYELPEIIAVPIERGLPEYINWINSCHASK
ncbi:divalent-cation tolerance protein CutA [Methyloglobulus sp.]|uniref:divalent-cation tolerance protein CutA n=1 Tax=Methyloglobulus sp. TaxID=2518622 RepID=UPI003989E24C